MKLSSIILCNFLLLCTLLSAETIKLDITFLGIKVVDVTMENSDSLITVKARSSGIASLAAEMDNLYISRYSRDYLPISYSKNIKQKDYRENRIISYDREKLTANRKSMISSRKTKTYPIKKMSRDFFSALFFLRSRLPRQNDTFWLDANTLIWQAKYRVLEQEEIRTNLGKLNTYKVELDFSKHTDTEKERSDMLTNNLVDEEKKLYFWFSADERKIPVKAVFAMKPFPVVWKITSYIDR